MTNLAIGVDIGGTGIKAALVDVSSGKLVSERVKIATPPGGRPRDIVVATKQIVDQLTPDHSVPVGIAFPSAIRHGVTLLAANISHEWVGLEAEKFFEEELGRGITFVNDADAAGLAEVRFGAAKGQQGLVIMTTLGTGIGGAFIYNGVLIPNAELGHLEIDGHDAETRASNAVRERKHLSWERWAQRLQRYYSHVEMLFSPELFIVGGGVSKHSAEFLPLLDLRTPIVPAKLLNNAGLMGAAVLAAEANGSADTPGSVGVSTP
jgi:polyphosphate glucokinase